MSDNLNIAFETITPDPRSHDGNHDDDLLSVAYRTVLEYPGGIEELAQAMGLSVTYLLNAVTGKNRAKFGLEDAERLVNKSGDSRLLQTFASHFGLQAVALPLPTLMSDDPRLQLQESIRSFGLCCLIAAARLNGASRANKLAGIISSFGSYSAEVSKRLDQEHVSLNDMKAIGRCESDLIRELTRSTLQEFEIIGAGQLISNLRATTEALALKLRPVQNVGNIR